MKTLKLRAPEASEAKIQKALMNRLLVAGWMVLRINGSGFKDSRGQYVTSYIVHGMVHEGRAVCSGFPDVLALRGALDTEGKPCTDARLFEIKTLTGEVSECQSRLHGWAKRFNVEVEIVRGWDEMQNVDVE